MRICFIILSNLIQFCYNFIVIFILLIIQISQNI